MRSSTWRLEDLRNVILNLGFVGENLHTRQIFDCKKMFDQYPQASVSMTVTPPEGEPYPGSIERDGDLVIWDVRDSDLVAEGDGEIQLVFTQEPHIARSYNARTHICRSQVPTGSIPSGLDDFVTRADQLLEQVEDTFPAGGTTGQVLAKKSDADYDTEWVDQGAGGTSDYDELENRPQIGGVTLTGNKTLNDLGAASEADVEAKYTKPDTGIPASDLAAGVIPDPEDLIDDTAGAGDTDKVWSADKSHALLTEITHSSLKEKYKKLSELEHDIFVQKDITLDPNNYTTTRCSVSADGDSLVVTRSDSSDSSMGYVLADYSSNPLDLSQSNIGIDFDVLQGTSGQLDWYETISEVCLILITDESASRVRYPMVVNSDNHLLYAGNYKMTLHLDMQRPGSSSIPVDLSAVKKIGFLISTMAESEGGTTTYPGTPSVKINRVFAYAFNRRKQVMFGFDGAYSAQMNAAEYLTQLGLPGVFFVNKGLVDTSDSGRMTSANLKTLWDNGHMIANYCSGYGHWFNLTLAQKKQAISENAIWLYGKGYGDGACYVSVQSGGYASDEASIYTEGYAKIITGRSIPNSNPQPSGFYDSQPYGHTNGPSASNSSRTAAVDSLIRNGGICIFIFHQCNGSSSDITLADFKAFADYVKAKQDAGLLEVVKADALALGYTLSNPKIAEIPATGISLNKDSATINNTGLTETLIATLTPSGATSAITWSSSDDDIASVENGVVTAKGVGTVTITATANGHSATCSITTKAYIDVSSSTKVSEANINKTAPLNKGGNGIGGFTTNGGTSRAGICTTGEGLTVGASADSTQKGFRIPAGAKSISITNPISSHIGLIAAGFFDADKYPVSGYETKATAIDALSWSTRDASYIFNIPTYTGDFEINVVSFAFREYVADSINTSDLNDITIEFLTTTVT